MTQPNQIQATSPQKQNNDPTQRVQAPTAVRGQNSSPDTILTPPFDTLGDYRGVIVTGAQRSGTTITARMIAHDAGFAYVDEEDFGTKDIARWVTIIKARDNFVIQCPSMARYVHQNIFDDLAVVFVFRPIDDIIKSQKRINWKPQARANEIRAYQAQKDNRPIALIKQSFWQKSQRHIIPNAFRVNYADLAGHPLWVPTDQRTNWGARDWQAK